MHALMVATFVCVMLADFMTTELGLPAVMRLTPELLSAVAAVVVVASGVRQNFRFVAAGYWILFGVLALLIVCGIIVNLVGTGPTIAGMRYYLRAIPFFFLPAVFDFKEKQIRQLLLLLLGLALLQVPLAVFQRWTLMAQGRYTGDLVFGTLGISSILSIFQICSVLVLVGLYLRQRIGKLAFVLLFFVLLVPTMINETKGTVLLLPLGLFTVLMVGSPAGKRLRIAGWAATLLAVFGAIFVPVYDYMNRNRPYATPIAEFFTDREHLDRYLQTGAGAGSSGQGGRIDALLAPFEYFSSDPVRLTFGLGLGNASHSPLGDNFVGKYFKLFKAVTVSSGSVFLLEIGVVGTALLYLLYWMVFRDALVVARTQAGLWSAIAVGWTGVVLVMSVAIFYKTVHIAESLSYAFWFFSGLIAARRVRAALAPATVPVVEQDQRLPEQGPRGAMTPGWNG